MHINVVSLTNAYCGMVGRLITEVGGGRKIVCCTGFCMRTLVPFVDGELLWDVYGGMGDIDGWVFLEG